METTPRQATDLEDLVERILISYQADDRTQHIDATFLPSRDKTIQILDLMRRLVFPGFFDEQRVTSQSVRFYVADLLHRIRMLMYEQVRQAIRYEENRTGQGRGDACTQCDQRAQEITDAMLERVPELRRLLALDVQAAYDGDPACRTMDEVIFCYPGLDAVTVYRMAHELFKIGVPFIPRMMTEWAHRQTGIDIHPGAQIGHHFFIDHGTGVVIGETCVIGNHVKIYQGVTLGALSFPTDANGNLLRNMKRHPTIEDRVVIYANATVLGGDTTIGHDSVIGSSVWITRSVEPHTTVTLEKPKLRIRPEKSEDFEAFYQI